MRRISSFTGGVSATSSSYSAMCPVVTSSSIRLMMVEPRPGTPLSLPSRVNCSMSPSSALTARAAFSYARDSKGLLPSFNSSRLATSSNTLATEFLSILPLMLWYTQIKKFRWICRDLERTAPLEIAIEVAFAVEMRQQPAVPLVGDEQRVPGFLPAHIQHFIADEAARQTRRDRALKPLVHELVEIVQRHHLQAGFWIAEKHRVWTFAKVG